MQKQVSPCLLHDSTDYLRQENLLQKVQWLLQNLPKAREDLFEQIRGSADQVFYASRWSSVYCCIFARL